MSNLIPEGRYLATVTEWSTGTTQSKGTPYLRLGFRVEEGEFAGRLIDRDFYFTEKTLEYVAKDLITLGYEGDDPLPDFARAKKHEEIPLPVRRVQLVVRHEEYNGQVYPRVKFINAVAESKPMTDGDRSGMKAAFAAARANKGTSRAPQPQPIDDTPFLGLASPDFAPVSAGKPAARGLRRHGNPALSAGRVRPARARRQPGPVLALWPPRLPGGQPAMSEAQQIAGRHRAAFLAWLGGRLAAGDGSIEAWRKAQRPPVPLHAIEALIDQLAADGAIVVDHDRIGGRRKVRLAAKAAPIAQTPEACRNASVTPPPKPTSAQIAAELGLPPPKPKPPAPPPPPPAVAAAPVVEAPAPAPAPAAPLGEVALAAEVAAGLSLEQRRLVGRVLVEIGQALLSPPRHQPSRPTELRGHNLRVWTLLDQRAPGALTPSQIAEALGIKRDSVNGALRELKSLELAVNPAFGRWRRAG